jgi:thiol-disulfide isomerase/thioredoxin
MLLLIPSIVAADQTRSDVYTKLREYEGKIVVLNFWAAWCKPCKKELPMLLALQREFEAQGVQFVGANTDEAKDRVKADAFLNSLGINFPIWFGLSDEEMKPLGLGSSIPATALFDRDGKRAFRLIGELKKKELVERLEWLLGTRQGKPPKELLLPFGLPASEYKEKK